MDDRAEVSGEGAVLAQSADYLADPENVSVEVEPDNGRFHAASASGSDCCFDDNSKACAQRTSDTLRSNWLATSSSSSPAARCSTMASVLMPLMAGRPKRCTGEHRTGDPSSLCGRHARGRS